MMCFMRFGDHYSEDHYLFSIFDLSGIRQIVQLVEGMCVHPRKSIYKGVTPHLLWYAVFSFFRRYVVRKGSVHRTQTSCYIVRRQPFFRALASRAQTVYGTFHHHL